VSIAPIFSGFLQAGIYNGLDGHAGLAGWRWLFGIISLRDSFYITDHLDIVVNGVISMPIAVAAYFFLPDTPGTAKPNWIFTRRVRLV
jgi:ACS family pantothenate transporter-like MFS transporter